MCTSYSIRGKPSAEVSWNQRFCKHHFELSLYLELYEYCLDEGIADRNLIAKWKKVRKERERSGIALIILMPPPPQKQSGYENLCCLRCIQPRDTNFGTTCICRVPKSKLETVTNYLLVSCSLILTILHHDFTGQDSRVCTLWMPRVLWMNFNL